MKIAIATKGNWSTVSGHAGKAQEWLLFDCQPEARLPTPVQLTLTDAQLPHNFKDDAPHPLQEAEIVVAASAGDGFIRHMQKWGVQVLLTGEAVPMNALRSILAGQALPDTRFDITTALCKVRDLFSRH